MEKNKTYEFNIIDNGMEFEGIAKTDEGLVVFIPDTLKGEKVLAKVLKVNKAYAFAKLEKIIEASEARKELDCNSYTKCGGCAARYMTYENTLEIKRKNAINCLKKQNLVIQSVGDIIGMGYPYNYRNKLQYPVRRINGKTVMGMFAKRTHSIIENEECLIQDSITHDVAKEIFNLSLKQELEGYDELDKSGDIKNIMIRRGTHTGEIMCVLVVTNPSLKEDVRIKTIAEEIIKKYPLIKSFMINLNEEDTNVILSDKNICIYGRPYITDIIGEHTYRITVDSFFQVNTIQAESLYNLLKNNLKLSKDKSLLELYSGVGSIGIFLSDEVKSVYAVEIVESAAESAKENAKLNNITNVINVVGDAAKETLKLINGGQTFDYVVVDPPRKGLDLEGIELILKLKPEKIGYVSCNPATLARDLKLLSNDYYITSVEFVDMFPWTTHVECVAVLSLKEPLEY